MPEFKNGINLVLAADDNYAQHLGVALVSIMENHGDGRFLFFHILDNSISDKNRKYLEEIGRRDGAEMIFYDIPENLLADCHEINHISRAAYARFLIPEILPSSISRVLYLDSDIVVLKDIAELYDQDLGHFPLGAVTDVMAGEILRIYFYPGLSGYFNSGVLLLNLDYWRRENIKRKAWDFMRQHLKDIIRPDQDILNCLFMNNWKALDGRFNVDLKRKSFRALPEPDTVVLHYSDKIKPWHYLFSGASRCYYFNYLSKTPWSGFEYKDKNLMNHLKKYYLLSLKESKMILLPFLPLSFLDRYRRLLWRTYKIKK